jgi:hypothetical protein
LGITGHEHLAEQGFDLITQATNELGELGVVGLAVAADGDELNIAKTGLFNAAAGDEALAVGQQDDFEHHAWIVSTGARVIVLEQGIHGGEVQFVIHQIVQCKGKAAGDDLFAQDNGR